MSKSLKLENDNYLDSQSVTHNRELLSNILNDVDTDITDIKTHITDTKKTVIRTTLGSTTGTWNKIATISFDEIISMNGCFLNGTNEFYPVPRAYNNQDVTLYAKKSDNAIYEMHNYAWASGRTLLLSIEYN